MTRAMAHIEQIKEILPIDGADAIEVARVLNWKCVVKKGEFKVGDFVAYLEIDSWVPLKLAPFLQKGDKIREFNGIAGNRLKTIRLRGQLSQGLILPLFSDITSIEEGADVTEALEIQKWEAPENPQLGGQTKGTFPAAFPKTDQERLQNIRERTFQEWKDKGYTWEVTEKLEGSSMTVFMLDGVFGVCSRNQELKDEGENTFWNVAKRLNIEAKMRELGMDNIAIQGELVGPGIQGNIYGMATHMFYPFEVVLAGHEKITPAERRVLIEGLGLTHSPVFSTAFVIRDQTIPQLLEMANGKSVMGTTETLREGLVYKCNEDPSISFKTISDEYLLKQK